MNKHCVQTRVGTALLMLESTRRGVSGLGIPKVSEETWHLGPLARRGGMPCSRDPGRGRGGVARP